MTLFDIQGEYLRLYEMATNLEDPDNYEAFYNALNDLNTDLAEKSAGYVSVINQLNMEMAECDKVIEAFQAKKKSREVAIKRMKMALMGAMDTAELKELKAGDYTLKIANNGGVEPLIIDHPEDVPANFMKIKYEPDTSLIRTAIKAGKELNFAHLEPRGRHLNIK